MAYELTYFIPGAVVIDELISSVLDRLSSDGVNVDVTVRQTGDSWKSIDIEQPGSGPVLFQVSIDEIASKEWTFRSEGTDAPAISKVGAMVTLTLSADEGPGLLAALRSHLRGLGAPEFDDEGYLPD